MTDNDVQPQDAADLDLADEAPEDIPLDDKEHGQPALTDTTPDLEGDDDEDDDGEDDDEDAVDGAGPV